MSPKGLVTEEPRILLNTEVRTSRAGPLPVLSSPEVELAGGDILIELTDTRRPPALFLRGAAPSEGWAVVGNAHSTFAKEMEDAGWMLFFMAGEYQATALGFSHASALRGALMRLTRKARARNYNALEITRITRSRFLGFARVSIAIHLRHLQKDGALWRPEMRK